MAWRTTCPLQVIDLRHVEDQPDQRDAARGHGGIVVPALLLAVPARRSAALPQGMGARDVGAVGGLFSVQRTGRFASSVTNGAPDAYQRT
jgi:hypothetical protein